MSKALELADGLENSAYWFYRPQAAAELRRLHEVNAELLEALKAMQKQLRKTSSTLWTLEQTEADLLALSAIAKAEQK